MGLWHRTLDGTGGKWVQADRGARPSQSIFLTGAEKGSLPRRRTGGRCSSSSPSSRTSLEHTGGYTPEDATRVAGTLLPDILFYDPTRPASYPDNGRALSDDVMDVFLSILTNGKVTRDNVEAHNDLLPLPRAAAHGPIRGTGLAIKTTTGLQHEVRRVTVKLPAHGRELPMKYPTFYRTTKIDELSIFYREAGPKDAPALLLLHGLPSSSRMFEPLFDRLSDRYHLIAPDYPGFGHSDWPDPKEFAYTFDHYAEIMNHFTEAIGFPRYTLYMQDYGGPVGFRMALAHPERVETLIVQDAVAHDEGLGANWKARRAFWADRAAHEAELRINLLSLATTRTAACGQRSEAGELRSGSLDG